MNSILTDQTALSVLLAIIVPWAPVYLRRVLEALTQTLLDLSMKTTAQHVIQGCTVMTQVMFDTFSNGRYCIQNFRQKFRQVPYQFHLPQNAFVAGLSSPSGDCDPGFYCPGGNDLPNPIDTPCPIGLHCPTGSSLPVPCQPGYFANFSQAASCVICPAGYYCVPEEVIEGNNATCTKSKEI